MLVGQEINLPYALLIALIGLVVVISILAIIAILIIVISKIFKAIEKVASKKKNTPADAPVTGSSMVQPSGNPLPDSESQGELKLENVDEPTAAVIMAIVSNQSGIPLNRLMFRSIKLVKEK